MVYGLNMQTGGASGWRVGKLGARFLHFSLHFSHMPPNAYGRIMAGWSRKSHTPCPDHIERTEGKPMAFRTGRRCYGHKWRHVFLIFNLFVLGGKCVVRFRSPEGGWTEVEPNELPVNNCVSFLVVETMTIWHRNAHIVYANCSSDITTQPNRC